MFTIDEIRIEGEEDGFHLIVYTDDAEPLRFRIGLPDQFHAEVERTIGAWLDEGEAASGYDPRDVTENAFSHLVTDPKHPDYHDTMSTVHDNREGK